MIKSLLFVILSITAIQHSLYITITNISVDKQNKIAVSIRLDKGDLLKVTGINDSNISDNQANEHLFIKYVTNHLIIKSSNDTVKLALDKVLIDDDFIGLNISANIPNNTMELDIENTLFLELNQNNQKNLVILDNGSNQKGFEFNYSIRTQTINTNTIEVK